jgi:hypothetical protein
MSVSAKHQRRFSADKILDLLAARHSKDVFIAECKDGPTHYTSHMRIDAWTMNRSWAHPVATAYEIKVSRSDFVNDNKWHGYLPLCNQFYFVAPPDLIQPSELPDEAGLLTVAGSRLLTKKKAPHRAIQLPEKLYRYILMCRVVVSRSEFHAETSREDRAAQWRLFVNRRVETRELGYQVSKAIREKADAIQMENERLKKRMQDYDSIRSFLRKLDLDPDGYVTAWTVEDRLKEREALFPKEFTWAMRDLHKSLGNVLNHIEPKREVEADGL